MECYGCCERVKERLKNLPCGHWLCQQCLQTLLPAAPFCFHETYLRNITLSNNQQTAEKAGDRSTGSGIVMSRDPMEVNKLYEVQLTKKDSDSKWSLVVGVVTSPKARLPVPALSYGWLAAVLVFCDVITDRGSEICSDIGQSLKNLKLGSRVGVSVDVTRRLHLYVNGQHQGVVPCSDLPDPCYVMFELWGPYKKITALPLIRLK